jgi:hypothetical protein
MTRDLKNRFEVVVRRRFVAPLVTTRRAPLKDDVSPALGVHADRLHESLTRRLAIARIHVNMLTPQTLWAMVGKATSVYKSATPFTGEVFFGTLELFAVCRFHTLFSPHFDC